VKAVYCHWDGYLSGVGTTLVKNYTEPNKVRDLISLGGFSSLEETIEQTAERAYREEVREFEDVQDWLTNFNAGEEFAYLYREGEGWSYFPDFVAEIECPLRFEMKEMAS
jgi:hypothetical protein